MINSIRKLFIWFQKLDKPKYYNDHSWDIIEDRNDYCWYVCQHCNIYYRWDFSGWKAKGNYINRKRVEGSYGNCGELDYLRMFRNNSNFCINTYENVICYDVKCEV